MTYSARGNEKDYLEAMPGQPWTGRRVALLRLFERIEPRYDRLNRVLSFGLDQRWRRWAVDAVDSPGPWLDLASGTGDLALSLAQRVVSAPELGPIWRADLSAALLRVGSQKLSGTAHSGPALASEMDRLPFATGVLGAVVQGFALRHCRDYPSFFAELFRVLRPGGRAVLLDMRYPRSGALSAFYRFYFRNVLPRLAGLLGAEVAAYRFMVDSVRSMPPEATLQEQLRSAGFERVESHAGLLGAVRLLTAVKPGRISTLPA